MKYTPSLYPNPPAVSASWPSLWLSLNISQPSSPNPTRQTASHSLALLFSTYNLEFCPQPLCLATLSPLPGRDSTPHVFSCYLYTKKNQRILSFFIFFPGLSAPLPHPIEPLSFQPNLGIHILILIPFSVSEPSNNALIISILLISCLPLLIP